MAWAMSCVMGVRSGELSRTRYSSAISCPRRMADAGQAKRYSLDMVLLGFKVKSGQAQARLL